MPIFGVPLEVSNETRFENREDEGFLTWRRKVSGYPERCTVALLGKHTDRFVARQGDGGVLGAGWLDAASWGGSSVLPGTGRGLEGFDDLAFPILRFLVPEILYPGAARSGKGVAFAFAAESKRSVVRVGDERAVYREFYLVGFVLQEILPGLPPWGKSLDEEFGQQGLELGFWINNAKATLGGREDQGVPLDFCSGGGCFSAPNEVAHHTSDLATHFGVGILGCGQVPHGC
ncbi:unnamed protein product [Sphagnum jensenii]|uniref:Uncharacterized protein n=1 Tax=Sphagnum jensenii TaxID=128206 RepID=A0ABP1B3F7_9BRYO